MSIIGTSSPVRADPLARTPPPNRFPFPGLRPGTLPPGIKAAISGKRLDRTHGTPAIRTGGGSGGIQMDGVGGTFGV